MRPRRRPAAAKAINASWRTGIEGIIRTGQLLIEQRERWHNQPGKWSRLIGANQWQGQGLLQFGKSHVYRLIDIAEDPRLFPHVGILPSDTHTLFALTRLTDAQFDQLLADGEIHPEMKRSDAFGLVFSLNQHRRHLSLEERSFAVAEAATLQNGSNRFRDKKIIGGSIELPINSASIPIDVAAAKAKVSRESAKRAKAILADGTPEDKQDVLSGKASLAKKASCGPRPKYASGAN